MGLYEKMQTSPRLESEGIWLEVADNRIRLARAGGKNTKFIAAAEKIAREHKRSLDLMTEEQGRKLFSKLYAELIVLDWLVKNPNGDLDEMGESVGDDHPKDECWVRGCPRPAGVIVDFNIENVLETFNDLPDFLKLVKETAEDPALFRQELLKGIEGN